MAHGRRRFTKALCAKGIESRQEPEVEVSSKNGGRPRTKNRKCHDISPRRLRRAIKWRSAANEKPEMSLYLSENTKTGNFNQQRTLSGSFFVIPERLSSIRAVILAFTANKQTNTLNYIITSSEARLWRASLLWRTVDSVLAKACFRVVTCKASMHIYHD